MPTAQIKKGAKHPRPETRTNTRPGVGEESYDSEEKTDLQKGEYKNRPGLSFKSLYSGQNLAKNFVTAPGRAVSPAIPVSR